MGIAESRIWPTGHRAWVGARNHETVMCPHHKASHRCPGLHWAKCCHQVEGGDPSPVVRTGEATAGVLDPALGSRYKRGINTPERIQQRAMRMMKGLVHLPYEEKLREIDELLRRGRGEGEDF